MNNLLYHIIPMALSLAITEFIYFKIDKKYNITNKLDLILHIKQEWKPCFYVSSSMIILIIIGIIGIYVIDIQPTIYFIICGFLTGAGSSIAYKLNYKENKTV